MAAVSLRDVRKSYTPELQVIHGVSMEIKDGEFIVILGPSGCGKSTLLRMVAGPSPRARSRSAGALSTTSSPRTATSPWCSRTTRSIRT
jgi:ABC-type nitrate/sulfonate/bicarbonate transport system ATPase subunit